jgi:hypothetical protein
MGLLAELPDTLIKQIAGRKRPRGYFRCVAVEHKPITDGAIHFEPYTNQTVLSFLPPDDSSTKPR